MTRQICFFFFLLFPKSEISARTRAFYGRLWFLVGGGGRGLGGLGLEGRRIKIVRAANFARPAVILAHGVRFTLSFAVLPFECVDLSSTAERPPSRNQGTKSPKAFNVRRWLAGRVTFPCVVVIYRWPLARVRGGLTERDLFTESRGTRERAPERLENF